LVPLLAIGGFVAGVYIAGDLHSLGRVVLGAIRHDQTTQWQVIDLRRELAEVHPSATHPSATHRALRSLEESTIIYRSGSFIWETGAVRHLHKLGLIDL